MGLAESLAELASDGIHVLVVPGLMRTGSHACSIYADTDRVRVRGSATAPVISIDGPSSIGASLCNRAVPRWRSIPEARVAPRPAPRARFPVGDDGHRCTDAPASANRNARRGRGTT